MEVRKESGWKFGLKILMGGVQWTPPESDYSIGSEC